MPMTPRPVPSSPTRLLKQPAAGISLGGADEGAVRGFRVERITSLKVTTEPFAPVHSSDVTQDLAGWQASPLT